MLDEALRQRLESLNRGGLPPSKGHATPARDGLNGTIEPGPRNGCVPTLRRPPSSAVSPDRVAWRGLVRRGEVVETPVGQHLRVRLSLNELWPGGEGLVAARQQYLKQLTAMAAGALEPTRVTDAELAMFIAALPERTLALDVETCGFAGSALFLIGLLRYVDGGPAIELLVARDYSEEAAVLTTLWHIVARHDVLVTFNGKSFDWPMVNDRSACYRLKRAWSALPPAESRSNMRSDVAAREIIHIDILHHARRRWRGRLPDCRLQTLERLVCRRHRTGDIPGHRIPAVYADFVRTGVDRDMDAVLYHNALDLVTLFDLALRLAV